jgi:hypothetical protein
MIQKLSVFSLLLLVAFILSSCSVSKRLTNYQSAPSDSLLLAEKINPADYEDKYSKYDGVYLFVKNSMEHSGSEVTLMPEASGWEFHKIKKLRYLILNPDNEKLTTYSLRLHPKAEVNSFYLLSVSPSGEIKKYKLSDLYIEKDAGGYLIYKFSYPGIVKGSVIEEGIDLT